LCGRVVGLLVRGAAQVAREFLERRAVLHIARALQLRHGGGEGRKADCGEYENSPHNSL